MNLLVVEDDQRIAKVLEQTLTEDGHRVFISQRGDEGLDLITSNHFDLAVLDIMLPGLDGLSLLKQARGLRCTTPVLMLSAKNRLQDVVKGLDFGADDYLTKPFEIENLLARVRAVGRRGHTASDNNLTAGSIVLDRGRRMLVHDGKDIAISRKEYLILELLMRRVNQTVSRAQIIEAGWGFEAEVSDNLIESYVSTLRSKLDDGSSRNTIRTIRSIGYCFSPHDAA
jgi:DNA-binding response OmpR family regulator